MKVWVGGEVGLDDDSFENYRIITNKIENDLNKYLEDTGYKNKDLDSLDVIAILRDDDHFDEIKKYRPKKKDTDIRLKINYDDFKHGDETTRKRLIYQMILKAIDFLENEKGLNNFEPIKEYINNQIQSLS